MVLSLYSMRLLVLGIFKIYCLLWRCHKLQWPKHLMHKIWNASLLVRFVPQLRPWNVSFSTMTLWHPNLISIVIRNRNHIHCDIFQSFGNATWFYCLICRYCISHYISPLKAPSVGDFLNYTFIVHYFQLFSNNLSTIFFFSLGLLFNATDNYR